VTRIAAPEPACEHGATEMKPNAYSLRVVLLCALDVACGSNPAAVGAHCGKGSDCATGYCDSQNACACAPVGQGCNSDVDCCAASECRGLVCVGVSPAPECLPAGALISDSDASPPCCSGMSDGYCCNPPLTLCSADEQCCFGGPGACVVTEPDNLVPGGGGTTLGVGACCLPPGVQCSADVGCCGGLSCGPNRVCCYPDGMNGVSCITDSDCCSGHCSAGACVEL
jgi:hypothetical protein